MTQRKGILIALFGVGVIVVGVMLAGNLLRRSTVVAAPPTPRAPLTAPVVIVTHDIPLMAVLQASDLALMDVPVEVAPRDALTNIQSAVGMLAKFPLVSGEMVMPHNLADPTNTTRDYAFTLRNDQVMLAFPTDDLMSQIQILQPGDQVDILVSIEEPVEPDNRTNDLVIAPDQTALEAQLFTFNALQRMSISAVVVEVTTRQSSTSRTGSGSTRADSDTPAPTPTPDPSAVEPRAILLALSAQDALVLKHLKDAGGVFDIVLRSPSSTQHFEVSPVTSEYLKDRFQLVITR